MLDLRYDLRTLNPAVYNPRKVTDEAIGSLQESIRTLGLVKPIIATDARVILAGHQRTRAMLAMGCTHGPVFVVSGTNETDEVRFNQMHNGTDLDTVDHPVSVPPSTGLGYADVAADLVACEPKSQGVHLRKEIMLLMCRYGQWGGAVATQSGEVLSGQQYAISCHVLGRPCRVFRIPDDRQDIARGFFGRQYGEFSYSHLPRRTWVQSLAQPIRLRGTVQKRSVMYDTMVIPSISQSTRLLDFGCGHGDHVRELREKGYQAFGVEFFHRRGDSIDARAVHRMIDGTLADLATNGLFDVVVLDSVLTSTDSPQARDDVITCASALCRPGGRLFAAGKSRDALIDGNARRATTAEKWNIRRMEFLDSDGFTAYLRHGSWYYQWYPYDREAVELVQRFVGEPQDQRRRGGYWLLDVPRTVDIDPVLVEASLRREFDLPWPGGRTVGRADAAVTAWLQARARSGTVDV